jgi:hypothetical protein
MQQAQLSPAAQMATMRMPGTAQPRAFARNEFAARLRAVDLMR